VRQQAQHGQADQKAIRRLACTQPERRAERIALRTRQTFEQVQHLRAQLLQAGKRKLHLGLHTRRAHHTTPRRPLDDILQ
jgi:hypothetical protein